MLNFTIILNIINLAKIKLLLENGQPGPVRVVHVVVAHVTRTIDVTPVSIIVVEVVRGPKPKAILLLRHNPRLNFMFNPIFFPLIYLSVNFLLRRLAKGFSRGLTSVKCWHLLPSSPILSKMAKYMTHFLKYTRCQVLRKRPAGPHKRRPRSGRSRYPNYRRYAR